MESLQNDAIENVAGYICHKLKCQFPTIVEEPKENAYTWVDHLNEGGLSKPSSEFVAKVADLETIFKDINGDTLLVCSGYQKKLMSHAANIDCAPEIKKLFFRSRMYFTIRKLNTQIQTFNIQKRRKMNKIKN